MKNMILSLFQSASLLFTHSQLQTVPTSHYLFCVMKANGFQPKQICERFSENGNLRSSSLQSECSSFMMKDWSPSEISECSIFLENDMMNEIEMTDFNNKWSDFTTFMIDFNKVYKNLDEVQSRFLIYNDNLNFILQHNREQNHSYELGINHFGDWSHEEYKEYVNNGLYGAIMKTTCPKATEISGSLPASMDLRTKGVVNEIQDQGQCGSCWTFSSSSAVEGAYAQKSGKLEKMSEQSLVDCVSLQYGSMGCNGGSMDGAFNYIHDNGIASESSYPYTAKDGTCQKYTPVTKLSGCYDVPANELQLSYQVAQRVVSIAIQADGRTFQLYKSGVYDDANCYTGQLDHGVSLVGYGHDSSSNKDYYILRNSWATTWGESGYMRIGRNSVSTSTTGICGLAMMASYPVV